MNAYDGSVWASSSETSSRVGSSVGKEAGSMTNADSSIAHVAEAFAGGVAGDAPATVRLREDALHPCPAQHGVGHRRLDGTCDGHEFLQGEAVAAEGAVADHHLDPLVGRAGEVPTETGLGVDGGAVGEHVERRGGLRLQTVGRFDGDHRADRVDPSGFCGCLHGEQHVAGGGRVDLHGARRQVGVRVDLDVRPDVVLELLVAGRVGDRRVRDRRGEVDVGEVDRASRRRRTRTACRPGCCTARDPAPSGTWTTATGICVENGYVPGRGAFRDRAEDDRCLDAVGVALDRDHSSTSSVSGAEVTTDASTWASPVYGMATKSLGRPASVKSDSAEKTTCDRPLASVAGHDGDW